MDGRGITISRIAVTRTLAAVAGVLFATNAISEPTNLHARGQRSSRHCFGLPAVFAFLAVDGAAESHARIIEPLRSDATGLLSSTWVTPTPSPRTPSVNKL